MRFAWEPWCLVLALQFFHLPTVQAGEVPQEGWIVWASNRQDGRHEIYRAKADGSEVLRLTTGGGRFATWSPDGSWVSYYREDDNQAWLIRPDGSEDHQIADGNARIWSFNGGALMVQQGEQLLSVNPATGEQTPFIKKTDFARIKSTTYKKFEVWGLSADQRYLVVSTDFYLAGAEGDNGYFKHGWGPQVLDLQQKDKIYFIGDGCEGTLSPTSNIIYHVNGEVFPETRFYRMDLNDLATRDSYELEFNYKNEDWGHEYFPRISTDGNWMAYGATDWDAPGDTECHDHHTCDYEIFIRRLGSTERQRLTTDPLNDQWPHLYIGPLWDPQGPPRISLSHTAINFSAESSSAPPAEQSVTISNPGGGTLAQVATTITYAGEAKGWLTITVQGSDNAQTLKNRVTVAGLPAGTHLATVAVTSPNAAVNAQSYQVTFELHGDPSTPGEPTGSDPDHPGDGLPGIGEAGLLVGGCALGTGGSDALGTSGSDTNFNLLLLLTLLVLIFRRR